MATLTEAKIAKLKWDDSKRTRSGNVPKHQIHNDPDVSGHHIKLYPPKATGRSGKVFYLGYGPSTNRQFYKIGQWGDVTLEQARAEARKIRRELHRFGIDPNKARRARIRVAKRRLTGKQLVDEDFKERSPVSSNSYTDGNRGFAKRGGRAKGEPEDVTHPPAQGDLWEEIVLEVIPKPNEESMPVFFVKDLAELPDPQDVGDSGDGGTASVQEESGEHDDSEAASGPDGQAAEEKPFDPSVPYVDERLAIAVRTAREGRMQEAARLYIEILSETPAYPEAQFRLGTLYDDLGRPELAIERFRAASALDPTNARVRASLGAAYGAVGRFKAADTEVQLALSLDPTSLEVRAEQGLLAFRKGLNADAEEILRGVCKQDPRHAAAHFYLGEALNRLGRIAEAVEAMERVIELQPHNWRAYHTLGMLFDRMYEPDRAAEMHRRAGELTCVDSARG